VKRSDLSVLEERLSYAQCWEDPAVLTQALDVGPGDDVLSVCSAGDNSFALAIAGARSVTCVDLSAPQLALAELKLTAARVLPVEGLRSLLGLDEAGRRTWLYHQVRDHLRPEVRAWADAHEDLVRLGLLGQGRFERYLDAFRRRVLPLVHGRGTTRDLLALDDPSAQRAFYDRRWNTLRWRLLFGLFFSRAVMARSGRSAEQFRYVEGSVSRAFFARAEHVLTDLVVATNPFVQWMLGGRFPDLESAHPYLSRAGHAALAGAAGRITFVKSDLLGFLERCEPGRFSAFNYSNVPEYLSADEHHRLIELTARAARPGARIAYWNLLVPRWRPDDLAHLVDRDPARSAELLARDRAFVYGGFHVETVRRSR